MLNPPIILDGTALAAQCNHQTALAAAALPIVPTLATVLVGNDPGSAKYVAMKQKRCAANNMNSIHIALPEQTTTSELIHKLTELSADPSVHGILLQHPLPHQIDERAAFDAIIEAKDVDGTSSASFAAAALGAPGHRSCTPAAVMFLLSKYNVPVEGANIVVIGRSAILGKPLAAMLTAADATVTITHSRTRDLSAHTRGADVVIAAAGTPGLVTGDMLRPGATVIDVGFTPGDVDFASAAGIAGAISPVPGGVGPLTVAMLLRQTVTAAYTALDRPLPQFTSE